MPHTANDTEKKYTRVRNIGFILTELKRSQPVMLLLLIAEFTACAANSLLTTFTGKYMVELALGSSSRVQLAVICLLLVTGERLTKFISSETSDYRLYVGSDRFLYHLKRRLIHKNMTTDYANNESCDKSDILKKAEAGAEYAAFHTADSFIEISGALLSLLAYGAILSFLDPLMMLIVGIPSVICYYIEKHKTGWLWKNASGWQKSDRELMYIRNAATDFSAAKDIRIYGMEKWFGKRFSASFGERLSWYNRQDEWSFRHDILRLITVHAADIAAYIFVIHLVAAGNIGAGDFVLYFGSIAAFSAAVRSIFDSFSGLEKLSGHILCTREYLDIEDATNRGGRKKLPEGGCEIEFRNVTYTYSGAGTPTINNISFTLHKGEKLALVGLNGAGKTTLIKLMCGLYDPSEGEILLNGIPVNEYNRDEYFSMFSAVFQDISELPVSIAENISGKSRTDTDEERLTECMEQAGIYEKVMDLPGKENTRLVKSVYEDAAELSGGQMQGFALARALYKNAPILLLDEPTAALDPIAEQEMYLKYADFSKGRTSVFISHRLASTRFCDRIIMIENGRITEEGTHTRLMEKHGKYAELYELQSSYYNDGEVCRDE